MTPEELKKFIESRGYTVKNIRVFKKTFHVNYHGPQAKYVRYYGVPLSSIPSEPDGSKRWLDFAGGYPKVN